MLPELKITQLRHFVWVAELKGFHAAAEKAHRTQPAISLSIKDLENKLGEPLFEKRNAKATNAELTPFGQHFMPQAKELIAHHDRIAKDMTLMAEHKTGHLRLASVPSIASRMLPVSSLPRAVLLGALWGWLPCGLVYSTLLWSASQGNAFYSALLMLAFGLGTWPVLLATGLAAERTTALLRKRGVRVAGGLLVMLFGLWTLPGPHQHWLMGH